MSQEKGDRVDRLRRSWYVGIVGLLVLAGVSGCAGSVTSDPPAAPTPTPSVAYMLAVVQHRGPVSQNDPLVQEFQSALRAVAPKCTETPKQLANEAVATQRILAKNGVTDSYLDVFKALDASIPMSVGRTRCADVFALYATLRIGNGVQSFSAAPAEADPSVAAFVQNLVDTDTQLKPMYTNLNTAATDAQSGGTTSSMVSIQQAQAALATAQQTFNAGPLPPSGYGSINSLVEQALNSFKQAIADMSTGVANSDGVTMQRAVNELQQGNSDLNRAVDELKAKNLGQSQGGSVAAPTPTPTPQDSPTATALPLSPIEQAVASYHAAVRALYGQTHDATEIGATTTGAALTAVECIARNKPGSLESTGSYLTYNVLSFRFGQAMINGNTATIAEDRHDIITLHSKDGSITNNDTTYTASFSLTNDGNGWKVSNYTWKSPDGSTGGAAQDARPCGGSSSPTPSGDPPAGTPTPTPNTAAGTTGTTHAGFSVSAWVDPSSMPYDAYPTLYAKTAPGADCTATVTYSTGRSPVSFGGSDQVADSSGQVSWPWHEETEGDGGTADVTCTFRGRSQDAQASFSVTG